MSALSLRSAPAAEIRDEPRTDWRAFRAARDESNAQVCPLCGEQRWYDPEWSELCCRECLEEQEADAVEDLAALAGALA